MVVAVLVIAMPMVVTVLVIAMPFVVVVAVAVVATGAMPVACGCLAGSDAGACQCHCGCRQEIPTNGSVGDRDGPPGPPPARIVPRKFEVVSVPASLTHQY